MKLQDIWHRLNLGTKLAVLINLVVTGVIVALTIAYIDLERTQYRRELVSQANLLLDTISLNLRDQLYRLELDELMDIARVVSQNPNVTQFTVYDRTGKVLVDSSQTSPGFSQQVDPLGSALISLPAGQIQQDWQAAQLLSGQSVILGNQTIGAVAIGLSTQPLDKKIANITLEGIVFGLLVLTIGSGLSFLLARQVTNPLSELTLLAKQMTTGNTSLRANVRSRDEAGQLGEAFNQMAEAIEQRENELRSLASKLEATVAERTAVLLEQNQTLEQMAITDPLTQAYNRRHFFRLAEVEIQRCIRQGLPIAVIILDADNFKLINDSHGHMTGDQVLMNLVAICQENIRKTDILARYGGEEFVILMPETDSSSARAIGERLRKIVEDRPYQEGIYSIPLTISLGIACWSGKKALNLDAFIAQADQALYKSKQDGRNRVTVWVEEGD